ncbi:MAG: hypothetical protein AB1656_15230 [Candidatus Omnitrophota bacterium]
MDEYRFHCRCGKIFDVEIPPSFPAIHLLTGILSLGFARLWELYRLSQCPKCGKRRFRILFLAIMLLFLSIELIWGIYYFTEIAPLRIVRDASMAGLPDNIDLEAPVGSGDYTLIFSYVWTVGIMPSVGAYISMYWLYAVVIWFGAVTLIGLYLPSRYKRTA